LTAYSTVVECFSTTVEIAARVTIEVENVRLSEQQLQIVQSVRSLGSAVAKDVQKDLSHLNLAQTTVSTLLARLEKKGVLTSELSGRERIFSCALSEDSLRRSMVSSLVNTLFNGNKNALMTHLVQEGEFADGELDELRMLINRTDDLAQKPEN